MNCFSLEDKKIVVTGASSGIGFACAKMIALQGGKVILIARNQSRLEKAFEKLPGTGHVALAIDITDSDAVQAELGKEAKTKKIDGLVCCAGKQITLPLRSMSAEKFTDLFRVNVTASLEMSRIISRRNIMNPNGTAIVFISSVMGLCGQPGLVAYSASKGALISASKSLAVELASKKVRVNCVSPGHVLNTGMSDEIESILTEEQRSAMEKDYPMGLGQPTDVAACVAFLLSDAARWITGTNLILDGGYLA